MLKLIPRKAYNVELKLKVEENIDSSMPDSLIKEIRI